MRTLSVGRLPFAPRPWRLSLVGARTLTSRAVHSSPADLPRRCVFRTRPPRTIRPCFARSAARRPRPCRRLVPATRRAFASTAATRCAWPCAPPPPSAILPTPCAPPCLNLLAPVCARRNHDDRVRQSLDHGVLLTGRVKHRGYSLVERDAQPMPVHTMRSCSGAERSGRKSKVFWPKRLPHQGHLSNGTGLGADMLGPCHAFPRATAVDSSLSLSLSAPIRLGVAALPTHSPMENL